MFLSDTEELVQEKVLCCFCSIAIMVHSSVSDKLLLSGHLSHHTMPACVNAGGLGDRVRSYSGKLRREFCPTPCRGSQGEPRTPGQSVGTSASKCPLGHVWAAIGTAPQHNQQHTCTQSTAGLSLAASTHRRTPGTLCNLQVCTE